LVIGLIIDMNRTYSQGFSLIELIMVIVIVGILATMTTKLITLPVNSYLDLQRRTTLVDTAELTLRRMQRDIRRALPNSIRITGGGTVIEMLHISEGGRYRGQQGGGSGNILDFTTSDLSFDVIGTLSAVPTGELVIYNLGVSGADAYASTGNNRATLSNTSTTTLINLQTAKQFPFQSPQQRFYVVDTPITYRCFNNQLLRYAGYAITSTQPNPPGVTGQVQADKIASCSFIYAGGTATRSGLVSLEISLTDSAGESVRLMHQVHVDNMP
jgi:MSHA biogenesis protein MshO